MLQGSEFQQPGVRIANNRAAIQRLKLYQFCDFRRIEPLSEILLYTFSRQVVRRSLTIAMIVGCILSIVNQYDVLAHGPFTSRLWTRLFFNFLVPFAVSSTSAAVNRPRPGQPQRT